MARVTSKKAVATVAAVVLAGGALTACGTSESTAGADRPDTTTTAPVNPAPNPDPKPAPVEEEVAVETPTDVSQVSPAIKREVFLNYVRENINDPVIQNASDADLVELGQLTAQAYAAGATPIELFDALTESGMSYGDAGSFVGAAIPAFGSRADNQRMRDYLDSLGL